MAFIVEERRQRRSGNQNLALRYQLETIHVRASLEAVVLADSDGLVLAAAGDRTLCEELGAFVPLMYQTVLGTPLPPLLEGARLAVKPTRLLGQSVFLAAVGGDGGRDYLLIESLRGVERIMATN